MVPAALCIDAEPDEREVTMPAPVGWSGFEKAIADLGSLRDVLGRTGTAVVNWFVRVDPQLAVAHGDAAWPLRHYRSDIDALIGDGDEVGLHPHSWRWDERFRRWCPTRPTRNGSVGSSTRPSSCTPRSSTPRAASTATAIAT